MRFKKYFYALLFFLLFLSFSFKGTVHAQEQASYKEEILEGQVTRILEQEELEEAGATGIYQRLEILVTKGTLENESIVVENNPALTGNPQAYEVGDKLVITYTTGPEGNDLFIISDYVRRQGLLYLFITFALLSVVVGRVWGATSLVGMAFSFFVIFKFILPQIIAGRDAVIITILGSLLIIPTTFSLSHGFKKKTLVAGIGTVIALVITGLLAVLFVEITHLTGFSAEEASFLQFQLGETVNMKGILLAGIIIASLGVLDDITISQASVVEEIREANKKLKPRQVFTRAMKVGRDHIASLVNTLILVYTGASMPLLLLFINSPRSFSEVINYEIIADEIVRTLVGSIGLILAVPITTFLAVYYFKNK